MSGAFTYQHAMANPDESLAPIYQGIYQESELSNGQVGKIRRLGPRTYVYAKNGAVALVQGQLTIQPVMAANHQNIAVALAAAVSDNEVKVTLGATLATVNQYEDGYLLITDEDSQGTSYRIRSNPAAASGASMILTLYDKLHTALTTSSKVHLLTNPYNSLVISAGSQAAIAAGVPNIAVTANYYYWSQVGGPCAVLHDADPASLGDLVTISENTNGAVGIYNTVAEPIVGTALILGVSTQYSPVDLSILR